MKAIFALPHLEPSPKRIRVLFAGSFIVDTKNALLVWLKPYYPWYFFKAEDLPEKYLGPPISSQSDQEIKYDLVFNGEVAKEAVTKFTTGDLAGLVQITFSSVSAWFEEEEQIFGHPKDPYKRVDVLQSSRNIRVELNGVELANTTKPRLLYETGLPVRSYIPKSDCHLELLVPSELTTACPYKGVANYYHVQLPDGTRAENVVWWYRNANLECAQINGFAAFYDEKLDVYVDGEPQKRPVTWF